MERGRDAAGGKVQGSRASGRISIPEIRSSTAWLHRGLGLLFRLMLMSIDGPHVDDVIRKRMFGGFFDCDFSRLLTGASRYPATASLESSFMATILSSIFMEYIYHTCICGTGAVHSSAGLSVLTETRPTDRMATWTKSRVGNLGIPLICYAEEL